jgi:quercetin dioxygenase-like cupin family protein
MQRTALMTVATVFCMVAAGVSAQEMPPKENTGVEAAVLTSIDLGPEIEGMQGRLLRMRKVTVAPGGATALHSHKDRPTVVHVLEGTLTVHVEGQPDEDYAAGKSFAEGKLTTHWAENKGSAPVVLFVTDVFKQQ